MVWLDFPVISLIYIYVAAIDEKFCFQSSRSAQYILYDPKNYRFNPQATGISISKLRVYSALNCIYRQWWHAPLGSFFLSKFLFWTFPTNIISIIWWKSINILMQCYDPEIYRMQCYDPEYGMHYNAWYFSGSHNYVRMCCRFPWWFNGCV